ncbi:hypothetical protein L1887_01357 [Cichorium endivia]|nr:hypothetical protein L1887_01357 [Cichorium endivia]
MVQRSRGGGVIAKVEAVTSDGGFTVMLLWYCGGVDYSLEWDKLKSDLEVGLVDVVERLQPGIDLNFH